jgi:hypothetical protein
VDTRVVTLHTENNHLCQVVTTFSKGLTSLNNLTRQVQFLGTGTSGTDFNIVSSVATHTFNLPIASATNTGKLSSTDWSTFNNKQPAGNYVTLDTTQTITAAKTFSGVNTFSQNPVINGTGTNSAYTILQSDGTNKWRIGNNYASGVNTFDIFSYDNSSTPLSINSNGFMTLSANVITTGAQIVQNGLYLNNVQAGPYGGYTNMWGATDGINFLLGNAAGGAKFIFASANSYNYTFPAATGTLALTSNLSAYLPLSGGTLTGALSGTSATFSGNVTSNGTLIAGLANGNIRLKGSTDGFLGVGESNGTLYLTDWATGAKGLSILLSTGAATFSSNVSLGNNTATSTTTPINISLGGTFGTTLANGTKIKLFDNGTVAHGIGVISGNLYLNTNDSATDITLNTNDTERMRITSGGYLKASNTGNYSFTSATGPHYDFFSNDAGNTVMHMAASNTSYSGVVLATGCGRTANAAYSVFRGYSGDGGTGLFNDKEFDLYGDGNGKCDGSWTGGGADYAEYFEWADGNINNEDRRGYSVSLIDNKIKIAEKGENIIGVISGNPSIVGDAAWNKWSGKHLKDDFGSYILDEDGNRILNPNYDENAEYIPREKRPEWSVVGLMGKLRIRKGQATMPTWIKMRDVSENVEEWLIK